MSDGSESGRSNSNQRVPSSLWVGIISVIRGTASLVVSRGELGVVVGRGGLGIHVVDDWVDESKGGLSSIKSVLVEQSDKTGNQRSRSRGSSNKLASSRSLQEADVLSNGSNVREGSVGAVEKGAGWESDST